MTQIIIISLAGLNALLLIVVVIILLRPRPSTSSSDYRELKQLVSQNFSETQRTVNETVRDQLTASQDLMSSITRNMTRDLSNVQKQLSESAAASKQVLVISESLKNLEKVLTNQKQRGNLGEAGLRLTLENVLAPEMFQMQYQFSNGDIVDAVIHTAEGIIPIDSKFSLENYQRMAELDDNDELKSAVAQVFLEDLKKRIDETAKYVRPSEGTLGFALMYIPAEGIYYDLLINKVSGKTINARSLIDYAYSDRKVIIVSPTTLLAYLQTILHGYRAFKLEQSVDDVRKHALNLSRHMKAFEDTQRKMQKALGATVGHFNTSNKKLRQMGRDVTRISNADKLEIEEMEIDRPVLIDGTDNS